MDEMRVHESQVDLHSHCLQMQMHWQGTGPHTDCHDDAREHADRRVQVSSISV